MLILHPGCGAAGTAEIDHCMLLDPAVLQERLILARVQEAVEVLSHVLAVTGCLQHRRLWRRDVQISKPSTAECLRGRVELRLAKACQFAIRQGATTMRSTYPANVWGDDPAARKAVQDDPVQLHLPAPLQPPVAAAKTLSLSEDCRVHALHSAGYQLIDGPLGRCCACAGVVAVQEGCPMQRAGEQQPA